MFGMAQGLSGFVGGFNRESNSIRQEEQSRSDQDAAIEQRALEHLANADDPQIRAAAVTAMLTPKKGSAASGFQKWFGQQRNHPVFDQIQQLVGGGAQPFMSPEEKSAAARSGAITGAGRGYAQTLREEGYEPTEEGLSRVASGAAGAPYARPQMSGQSGKITLKDGRTIIGSFDKVYQSYQDGDGNQISADDIANFEPTATHAVNPSQGGAWKSEKDPTSSTGYRWVHRDAAAKEMGRGGEAPAPPPETFSPVQTPSGVLRFGNKSGAVSPAPGGEGISQPAPATADFETLKQVSDEIYRRASAGVFHPQGLPIDEKEILPKLDAEARAMGWKGGWNELQQALGQAQAAVGQRVQPPPAGIPTPPTQPTPKRTAPAPGGPKPKGKSGNQPGQLDISRILQELQKF